MNKKKQQNRALRVESLENRELMAGDLGVNMVNGTVYISGTNTNDNIRVLQNGTNLSIANGFSRPVASFPLAEVSALNIQANGGNDRVEVRANQKIFDSLFIDLGRGSNELVIVGVGGAGSVSINANASLGTTVYLDGYFTGLASVDYGDDPAADAFLTQQSTFDRLNLKMGKGNDVCQLARTSVGRASINMGAGDDTFKNIYDSNIQQGSIDGGTSVRGNRWSGPRFGRAVSVKGF